jgi:SAM-dependent methyltransferase
MISATRFDSWEAAVQWLRDQPDRQALVHAAYYDDPLLTAAQRYWESPEWQEVVPLLGEARTHALDVGAGRGIASFALAKEGFLRVTALEPDASALVGAGAIRSLATQSGLPIDVCQDFSERLPFADESFDVVFARAVLHHTRDLGAACAEFHRVLRPGGRLVAVREHVISRPEDLPEFLDAHPLHKLYGGENAFLLAQYRQALRAGGFAELVTLAPFDSAINLAPQTAASMRSRIGERVAGRWRGGASLVSATLALVWPLAKSVLNATDSRPGRLYSFVARKRS